MTFAAILASYLALGERWHDGRAIWVGGGIIIVPVLVFAFGLRAFPLRSLCTLLLAPRLSLSSLPALLQPLGIFVKWRVSCLVYICRPAEPGAIAGVFIADNLSGTVPGTLLASSYFY